MRKKEFRAGGLGVRNGPKREYAGESFQLYFIVSPPLQFFMATRAEYIDVSFGLIAQPDLGPFDRSDDTGGKIHGSTEDIAFIDLQGTDVDAGP